MNSCFTEQPRSPGDIVGLKDELSVAYADNARLRIYESARVYSRYQTLFGPMNLRVFMLSVQVAELKMKIDTLAGTGTPDPDDKASVDGSPLARFRNQIILNSGLMLAVNPDELPPEEKTYELTRLYAKISRLAHPLFHRETDKSGIAGRIMLGAETAYCHGKASWLKTLLGEAEAMLTDEPENPDDCRCDRIKDEIARLRAEREMMLMQFPLSLANRLDDLHWRIGETDRLLHEEQLLLNLKNTYENMLSSPQN